MCEQKDFTQKENFSWMSQRQTWFFWSSFMLEIFSIHCHKSCYKCHRLKPQILYIHSSVFLELYFCFSWHLSSDITSHTGFLLTYVMCLCKNAFDIPNIWWRRCIKMFVLKTFLVSNFNTFTHSLSYCWKHSFKAFFSGIQLYIMVL